jgi:hypothetical protein
MKMRRILRTKQMFLSFKVVDVQAAVFVSSSPICYGSREKNNGTQSLDEF